MENKKKCAMCDTDFASHHNTKFCSDVCKDKYQKARRKEYCARYNVLKKEEIAKVSKIRYEYLKLQKRCVCCAERDEQTLLGKVRCLKCSLKRKKVI